MMMMTVKRQQPGVFLVSNKSMNHYRLFYSMTLFLLWPLKEPNTGREGRSLILFYAAEEGVYRCVDHRDASTNPKLFRTGREKGI